MATTAEHMHTIMGQTNITPEIPARLARDVGVAADSIQRRVCTRIVDSLRQTPGGSVADDVVTGLDLFLDDDARSVAADLWSRTPGGARIGLAVPTPGSLLDDVAKTIDAYIAGPEGSVNRLVGTRAAMNSVFGDLAIALGADDRVIMQRYASAEHWLADWKLAYAPLARAYRSIDPAWRCQFNAALIRIVEKHGEWRRNMLEIPCYYLEFRVHTSECQ